MHTHSKHLRLRRVLVLVGWDQTEIFHRLPLPFNLKSQDFKSLSCFMIIDDKKSNQHLQICIMVVFTLTILNRRWWYCLHSPSELWFPYPFKPLTHAGTVRWLIVGHTQLRFRGHSLMRDCWRHARWRDSAMHARRVTNGVSIINTVTLRCIGLGSLYFSRDENTRRESHREGYLRSPQKLLPILLSSHNLPNYLKDSFCFL